jgi:hypothetical protein
MELTRYALPGKVPSMSKLTPVLAAVLALAVPAVAGAAPRTITADGSGVHRLGSLRVDRGASLGDARRAFGTPTKVKRLSGSACRAFWRRLGLTVAFANFGGGRACGRFGAAQVAEIAGRRARAAWRTRGGLRTGDTTARLRRLYPRARRHARVYDLVRGSFLGALPTVFVAARSRSGRVTSFRLFIGGAGE